MVVLHFWICTKLIKCSFIKEEPAQYNILFNAVHGYEFICPSIHPTMTVIMTENWWLNCSNDASTRHAILPQQTTKVSPTFEIRLSGFASGQWWGTARAVMHALGAKQVCRNTEPASYGVTVIIVLFAKVTSFLTYFKRLHRFWTVTWVWPKEPLTKKSIFTRFLLCQFEQFK